LIPPTPRSPPPRSGRSWWLNDRCERPNQLALARQAGTDVKMTCQLVRKLEAKGLLERHTDPAEVAALTETLKALLI
jgi:DNA-binding MarR family transcriptional regulator